MRLLLPLTLLALSAGNSERKSLPRPPRSALARRLSETFIATGALLGSSLSAQAKVRGYIAAQSAFAPRLSNSAVPRLAQSVLLNTLPIDNELVGEVQANLESFVQLIDPSNRQILQIKSDTSILWTNLKINAQRAAGMFLYDRNDLLPEISSDDTFQQQSKRRIYGEIYLAELKDSILKLVSSSLKTDAEESVRLMKVALTNLANVAYLLVPEPLLYTAYENTDASIKQKYANVPRLVGRATVVLTFQRPGPLSILKSDGEDKAKVTIIVDGINYPYTAGNFVNLCLNKYFDDTKVDLENYDVNGQLIPRLVFGDLEGYVDPFTGKLRTIPLEVLRKEKTKRMTVTGNAYNSLVFTRAQPVKSFATEGTIGMHHVRGDGNGASSAFFWIPPDRATASPASRTEIPTIARLNTRFAAFAHVVEGTEILTKLRPSDNLLSAEVLDGAWELIVPSDESGVI